ncbi:MAG TPA: hypothetical protein VLD15_05590 [Burkholderiales bacterium]|nr:hypothetical protein [Burkholderiales bacterium]
MRTAGAASEIFFSRSSVTDTGCAMDAAAAIRPQMNADEIETTG